MEMVTAKIEAAGLTPGQFGVLAIVAANPGLKQIELGSASASTVRPSLPPSTSWKNAAWSSAGQCLMTAAPMRSA